MDVLSEKKNTIILKGCLQLVPDGKKIKELLELDDDCDGLMKHEENDDHYKELEENKLKVNQQTPEEKIQEAMILLEKGRTLFESRKPFSLVIVLVFALAG